MKTNLSVRPAPRGCRTDPPCASAMNVAASSHKLAMTGNDFVRRESVRLGAHPPAKSKPAGALELTMVLSERKPSPDNARSSGRELRHVSSESAAPNSKQPRPTASDARRRGTRQFTRGFPFDSPAGVKGWLLPPPESPARIPYGNSVASATSPSRERGKGEEDRRCQEAGTPRSAPPAAPGAASPPISVVRVGSRQNVPGGGTHPRHTRSRTSLARAPRLG